MKNKYINPINIGLLSIILTLLALLYICMNKANNYHDDIAVSSIHQTETALVIHLQDNTSITISKLQLEEKGFINLDDIVDWNTNGDEIAISLRNGYEYYATKTKNIYTPKFKNYVGRVKEIKKMKKRYKITYGTSHNENNTHTSFAWAENEIEIEKKYKKFCTWYKIEIA